MRQLRMMGLMVVLLCGQSGWAAVHQPAAKSVKPMPEKILLLAKQTPHSPKSAVAGLASVHLLLDKPSAVTNNNVKPVKTAEVKAAPESDQEAGPSVLAPGSRVVASNSPDEDFVILGRLEPDLPAPAPETKPEIDAPAAVVDNTPPTLMNAPVEVTEGIQPITAAKAVTVAGLNIGEAPAVSHAPLKTISGKTTVKLAAVSARPEKSALTPPPQITAFLAKPVKSAEPAKVMSQPVKVAAASPMKAKAPLIKTAVTRKASVLKKQTLAQKNVDTAVIKSKVATKVKVSTVVKSVVALKKKSSVKPVLTPQHYEFASYQPPKHKVKLTHQLSNAMVAKPMVKAIKPAHHVAKQSHFKPVIKPFIPS